MARHNAKATKNEPPDRGKPSHKQNIRSVPKSPLRPARTTLSKTSSPKPLKKERFANYITKSFLKPPSHPSKVKKVDGAIPKLLKAVKESSDNAISGQFDRLENPLYTIKNVTKIKSTSTLNNDSNRSNTKNNLMDYEEIPNSSLPASTVTKLQDIVVTNSPSADELPEERNSVQGLINKNPAESSSIEASSSNLPGNNPNLLNLRDFDMQENHLTTARSILHLNEPPAATGKQATINANDVPPIMTEIPEITHFKAITVPPKAAKRIDTLIFNQIQENISEIRASLSKSEDVRGSSASSAGPPGTLNRSTGVQAGTSRCNFPLNSKLNGAVPKLPAGLSGHKNDKITKTIAPAKSKTDAALEIGNEHGAMKEGPFTHSGKKASEKVKITKETILNENKSELENDMIVLSGNEKNKENEKKSEVVLSGKGKTKENEKKK